MRNIISVTRSLQGGRGAGGGVGKRGVGVVGRNSFSAEPVSSRQSRNWLVLNSLDAKSSAIKVSIDHQLFKIQVDDNGDGISWPDLKLLGSRYVTSKSRDAAPCFGHRGEAIASLVQVSGILEIRTRLRNTSSNCQDEVSGFSSMHDDAHLDVRNEQELLLESESKLSPTQCRNTLVKYFRRGSEAEATFADEERSDFGTSVTVHDFFYCFPIRRKIVREAIDLENIKDWLEGMAVVHPKVSFSLKKDCGDMGYLLQVKKCSDVIARINELYGHELSESLLEVNHRIKEISIHGFISTKPSLNKRFQFLYVNKFLIRKTSWHKFLNKLLDRTVMSSSCLAVPPFRSFSSSKSPSSPSKAFKTYGIFFLEIDCPPKDCSVATETNKTFIEFRDTDRVRQCLEGTVHSYCKAQGINVSSLEASNCESKETDHTNSGSKFRTDAECSKDLFTHEEINLHKDVKSLVSAKTQEKLNAFSRKCKRDQSGVAVLPAQKYGGLLGLWDVRTAVQGGRVKRPRKDRDSKFSSEDDVAGNEQDNKETNSSLQQGFHEPRYKSDDDEQRDASVSVPLARDRKIPRPNKAEDPHEMVYVKRHRQNSTRASSLLPGDGEVLRCGLAEVRDDANDGSPNSDDSASDACDEYMSSLLAFKKIVNESFTPRCSKSNKKSVYQSEKDSEFKRKIGIHGRSSGNNKRLKNTQGSQSNLNYGASCSVGATGVLDEGELLARINSFGSSLNQCRRKPTHDLSSSGESSDGGGGEEGPRVDCKVPQRPRTQHHTAGPAVTSGAQPCKSSSSIQEFMELISLHQDKSSTEFSDASFQHSNSSNSQPEVETEGPEKPSEVLLTAGLEEHCVVGRREVSTRVSEDHIISGCPPQTTLAVPRKASKRSKIKQFIPGSPSNKNRTKVVEVKLPLKNSSSSSLGSSLRLKRKQELAKIESRNFFCQFRHSGLRKKYCKELEEVQKESPLTSIKNKSNSFHFDPLIMASRPTIVSRAGVTQPQRKLLTATQLCEEDRAVLRRSSGCVCRKSQCCSLCSFQTGSKSEGISISEHCSDYDHGNSRQNKDSLDSLRKADGDAVAEPCFSVPLTQLACTGCVEASGDVQMQCNTLLPLTHTAHAQPLTSCITCSLTSSDATVTDAQNSIKRKLSGAASEVENIPACPSLSLRNNPLMLHTEMPSFVPDTAISKSICVEHGSKSITEVCAGSTKLTAASSLQVEMKMVQCLSKLSSPVAREPNTVFIPKDLGSITAEKMAMLAEPELRTRSAFLSQPSGDERVTNSPCVCHASSCVGLDVTTAVTSSNLTQQASPKDDLTYNSHSSYSALHSDVLTSQLPAVSGGVHSAASPGCRNVHKVSDTDTALSQNSRDCHNKMVCATAAPNELHLTQAWDSSSKICGFSDDLPVDAGNSAGNNDLINTYSATVAPMKNDVNVGFESCNEWNSLRNNACHQTSDDGAEASAPPCVTLQLTSFETLLDLNRRASGMDSEIHACVDERPVRDRNISQAIDNVELNLRPETESTSVRGVRVCRDGEMSEMLSATQLLPSSEACNVTCAAALSTTDAITATFTTATSTVYATTTCTVVTSAGETLQHWRADHSQVGLCESTSPKLQLRSEEECVADSKITAILSSHLCNEMRQDNCDKLDSEACKLVLGVGEPLRDDLSSSCETHKSCPRISDVLNDSSLIQLENKSPQSSKTPSFTSPSTQANEFLDPGLPMNTNKLGFNDQFSRIQKSELFSDQVSAAGATATHKTTSLSTRLSSALKRNTTKLLVDQASPVINENSTSSMVQNESIEVEKSCNAVNSIRISSPLSLLNSEVVLGDDLQAAEPPHRLAGKLALIVSSERTLSSVVSEHKTVASDTASACNITAPITTDSQVASVSSDACLTTENVASYGGLTQNSIASATDLPQSTMKLTLSEAQSSAAVAVEQEWKQVSNEAGHTFYINQRNGNSSYSAPFDAAPPPEASASSDVSPAGVQLIPISGEQSYVSKDGFTKMSYLPISRSFGFNGKKRVSLPNKVSNQHSRDGELQIQLEQLRAERSDSLSGKVSRTMKRDAEFSCKEPFNSAAVSNRASTENKKISTGAVNEITNSNTIDFIGEHFISPVEGLIQQQTSRQTTSVLAQQLSPKHLSPKSTCRVKPGVDPMGHVGLQGKASSVATSKSSGEVDPNTEQEKQGCESAETVVRSLCAAAPNFGLETPGLRLPCAPEDRHDIMLRPAQQPCKFTKEIFTTCQVLGQLDRKFILCVVDTPAGDLGSAAPAAALPSGFPHSHSKGGHSADEARILGTTVDSVEGAERCASKVPSPSKMLIAFDQHAVHERIRLEALLADNLVSCSRGGNDHTATTHDDDELKSRVDCVIQHIKKAEVSPVLSLTLSPSDVRIMLAHRDKLQRCGFLFQVSGVDEVLFTAVPACMLPRPLVTHALAAHAVEDNGAQLIGQDGPLDSKDKLTPHRDDGELFCTDNSVRTQSLPSDYWTRFKGYRSSQIHDVVTYVCEQLRSCRTVAELPLPLLQVLHTHACRGAVRFGQRLRRCQCVSLLQALSKCHLPFQCAHGRPSLAPLVLLTAPPPRAPPSLSKLRRTLTNAADEPLQQPCSGRQPHVT
ncbi:DNA mismatch repair protein C-terminal [Trinorchestia longiramus]|nr:DNA mismatch repair protein C-terminal [Trinorchestia longiramus]